MDDCRKFRYDFFGEFVSQEEIRQDNRENCEGSSNLLKENRIDSDDQEEHNQLQTLDIMDKAPTDDSLMEFITDYFQGTCNLS